MKVLIDGSAAARIIFERQNPTGRGAIEYRGGSDPSPIKDFAYHYLKFLANVKGQWSRTDEDVMYHLMLDPRDSKNVWRHAYINEYYANYLWVAAHDDYPEQYICTYDGKFRGISWSEEDGGYITTSLSKKKATTIIEDNSFEYIDRSTLGDEANTYIDTHIAPTYKYGRKWPHKHMTKADFNEMRYESGMMAAGLTGMYVHTDPKLEADDLIFREATKDPNETVIILTVDADLNQTTLYNPNTYVYRMDLRSYAQHIPKRQAEMLWLKLLRGEPNKGTDYVMSMVSQITQAPIAPKAAEALAVQLAAMSDGEEQMALLAENVVEVTMDKNIALMMLANAPKPQTEGALLPSYVTYEDLNTTEKEVLMWTALAKEKVDKYNVWRG